MYKLYKTKPTVMSLNHPDRNDIEYIITDSVGVILYTKVVYGDRYSDLWAPGCNILVSEHYFIKEIDEGDLLLELL